MAPVFDEKPVAPVFDEKPVTPVFDEKPVTQASDDTLKNFLDSLKIPTTPLPQASDYADMPDLENLAPVLPKTLAKKSVQFAPGVKEEAISEDLGRIGCKYLPIGIINFLMDTCAKAGNEANTTECMIDFLLPAINYSSQTPTQRKQLYGRIKTKLNQPCSDPTQTDKMKYLGVNFATGYDNFVQGITAIPKRPCNSFKIGKFLGSGGSGAVFVACYSAECNLVVKIQRLDSKWETETKIAAYVNDNFNSLAPRLDLICVASLDDMFGAPENKGDLEYLKLVKDIAPLVPNYLNAKMGFMVLERFEGNLKQLAPQEFCSESDLRKRVRKRLDILHDNFIYHLDMSLENILYRRDQEDGDLWVAITDFGLSIAPKLIPLTAEDERNEINDLINRAKKGGFKLDKSNVRWPMGLVEYAEAFDWAMFDHTFDAYKKLTCEKSSDILDILVDHDDDDDDISDTPDIPVDHDDDDDDDDISDTPNPPVNKKSCQQFEFKSALGIGQNGSTYVACRSGDCNYVVKLQNAHESGSWAKEAAIMSWIDEHPEKFDNVPMVPKFYGACKGTLTEIFGKLTPAQQKEIDPRGNNLTTVYGFIFLEKLQGTIDKAPDFCNDNEKLKKQVQDKLSLLHRNLIFHGDPHEGNVLFKTVDGKTVPLWADFGDAIAPNIFSLDTENELRKMDITHKMKVAEWNALKVKTKHFRPSLRLSTIAKEYDNSSFNFYWNLEVKSACKRSFFGLLG